MESMEHCKANLEIPLKSSKYSEFVCKSLSVDEEPTTSTQKLLKTDGNKLHVELIAKDSRSLRASLNVGIIIVLLLLLVMSESAYPSPSSGRCIYGYVLLITSHVLLAVYLTVAFFPAIFDYIDYVNSERKEFDWDNEKGYWWLALPTVSIVFICTSLVIYNGINLVLSKSFKSIGAIKDSFTEYIENQDKEESIVPEKMDAIPPINDFTVEDITMITYFDMNIFTETISECKNLDIFHGFVTG